MAEALPLAPSAGAGEIPAREIDGLLNAKETIMGLDTPRKTMIRTCTRFLLIFAALFCWCASAGAAAHGIQGKTKKNAFGAIAHHRESRSFGYSYDYANSREARIAALTQCVHPGCEIVVSFRSACGALAYGPKKSVAATGITGQEARTKAVNKCAAANCEVLVWACTK